MNAAPHFLIGGATRNLPAKSKPDDHLSVVCFGASADGLVLAQKVQTASQPDMPQSAVKTGCVDQLLSPADILLSSSRNRWR
jgi:hypothetical protein